MDNIIICNIDMFGQDQIIIYPDGHQEVLNYNQIAPYLPRICFNEGLDGIHFFGNESFINGIVEQIRNEENMVYGKNHLEIEVN